MGYILGVLTIIIMIVGPIILLIARCLMAHALGKGTAMVIKKSNEDMEQKEK